MEYRKEIDEILSSNPNYLEHLTTKILDYTKKNDLGFLSFCLEYLPYSISEELILSNLDIILHFSKNDWFNLVQKMSFNPVYGKETLRKFLHFHTSTTDKELEKLGLQTMKIASENEKLGDYSLLSRDNPRIMNRYFSLGLDENKIKRLHDFKLVF